MSLNLQSGSTWSVIRKEINDKALDKTGDDMSGNLGINDIVDSENQVAIQLDPENKKIKEYGKYIGQKTYADSLFEINITNLPAGAEKIYTIDLDSAYFNGMCVIKGWNTSLSSPSYTTSMCWFSDKVGKEKFIKRKDQYGGLGLHPCSKLITGGQLINDGENPVYEVFDCGIVITSIHIDNSTNQIVINVKNDDDSVRSAKIQIDWEVW